jgi:hypothetical protein
MASLFSSLGIAGGSLDVLQQAIGVIQNNVTNATTPGYVTQTQELASLAFNPSQSEYGGVEATGVQSARDSYAEQSVWSASQQSGLSAQQSQLAAADFRCHWHNGYSGSLEQPVLSLFRLERQSHRCHRQAIGFDSCARRRYLFYANRFAGPAG